MAALAAAAADRCAAQGTTGTKPVALMIPHQGLGYESTDFWVAVDDGLFRRYGLDVSTEYVPNSPVIVASMLSGETPYANTGEDAVIAADLNGADIVMLLVGPDKFSFLIYGKPNLHKLADLKGGTLAISETGTSTEFNADYALRSVGLVPGRDVTLRLLGSQENRVAGLESGAVDATMVGFPGFDRLKGSGFSELYDMRQSDLEFYSTALVARRSWIKTHPAMTMSVLRGYLAGRAEVVKNKTAAVAALTKYAHIKDRATLDDGYRSMLKALQNTPIPRAAPVRTALEMSELPGAKTADPARFIDPSWIEELDRDGFMGGLAGEKQ